MGLEIDKKIIGIYASRDPEKHATLAAFIFEAGDGDHLEIGTLYGASAILAALTKREFGLEGTVVCVDPFDWDEIDPSIKALTDVEVSANQVEINAGRFDVRLEIHPVRSMPWPMAHSLKFASAYIDGNHSFAGLQWDWEVVSQLTDLILIDDYHDPRFPGVTDFIDNGISWEKEIEGQVVICRK